jgi:hypothetical protein
VPDIPLEETGPIREVATTAGLELVLLTTPTTPQPRMEAIAKASQGFVYLVSVTGELGCCALAFISVTFGSSMKMNCLILDLHSCHRLLSSQLDLPS